jgi:hypothetical protein
MAMHNAYAMPMVCLWYAYGMPMAYLQHHVEGVPGEGDAPHGRRAVGVAVRGLPRRALCVCVVCVGVCVCRGVCV